MKFTPTQLPDVLLIEPEKFGDERGFFSEIYSRRKFADAGIAMDFVQENHSYSAHRHTVRGLHYQADPAPQDKLVRVTRGAVMDVAVDIRRGSPTYGRHVTVELSAENWRQLLIPAGFAHGFCTLEDHTEVIYKVTDFYTPAAEGGIAWDDADMNIDWPTPPDQATVSDRDRQLPAWRAFESPFTYQQPLFHR